MKLIFNFLLSVLLVLLLSCNNRNDNTLFELIPSEDTGIYFGNYIKSTQEFNILNYLYFYDGGGVAIGDVNNDGLPDIFFTGNETENRLYLNKGDFEFEDITAFAGVGGNEGSWSKGVTMADVNGNGYLDIYISRVNYQNKEGSNQLFINNGDLTFTEKAAEYGLDFRGYSTQAVFFDYNKNGRLDMFLLNHSHHSERTYGEAKFLRGVKDPKAGDRLFRNDGDRFTDVTHQAGIYSSALGYGLGVAASDINKDGWPDIYVGNDFHEDDYLYINNGDGTFTEDLYSSFGHTSRSSMGNDIADINNDGYLDIVSLDMMPEDHERYMKNSGGPDEQFLANIKLDLGFGHKNARNTLQMNRGNTPDGTPLFSEIAFTSGVAQTDWSWASLFMDMNNDGWKDLYITNGMVRQPNDLDYIRSRKLRQHQDYVTQDELASIKLMPKLSIPNYAYQNNGDLTFTNKAQEWGLGQPTISSGAAYGDLNNNGRLDLVVNNTNERAYIYRNNTPDDGSSNYLKVKLDGDGINTSGIGSKVILYLDEKIYYQEQMPTRGFQSSVDHVLHFGLGEKEIVDSLLVIWPDDQYETIKDIKVNQLLELKQEIASGSFDYEILHRKWDESVMVDVTNELDFDFQHSENSFNDYSLEPLIPYKLSTQGPALAVGDINGDGLDDVYIGGSRGHGGGLFIQQPDNSFLAVSVEIFETDRMCEDIDAAFFDATGNGLLDLYVVSGGGELSGHEPSLKDRLYINKGNEQFKRSEDRLPDLFVNGSVVRPADINGNGHVDLFVGGRAIPFRYGLSPQSVILVNDGSGYFKDVTDEFIPELKNAGMITDAGWAFVSNDRYPDLFIAAEWMPIQYFRNDGEKFVNHSEEAGFANTSGLWQSLLIEDITGNGHVDILAGNFGLSSRIQASSENPFRLYINDFNGDGQTAPVMARYIDGEYYPFEQLDELSSQLNDLDEKVKSYQDYSTRTMRNLLVDGLNSSSFVRQITDLKTSIFKNNGDGFFIKKELPIEAQYSPVMVAHTIQRDGNRGKDIILGGNLFDVRPSIGGRQDASYGIYLQQTEEGNFQPLEPQSSGFYLRGEVRGIQKVKTVDGSLIFVTRNNEEVRVFK